MIESGVITPQITVVCLFIYLLIEDQNKSDMVKMHCFRLLYSSLFPSSVPKYKFTVNLKLYFVLYLKLSKKNKCWLYGSIIFLSLDVVVNII